MGTLHCPNVELHTNRPLPDDVKLRVKFTQWSLLSCGINIPVAITRGSAYSALGGVDKTPLPTASVRGHLDTGASVTVVDTGLARHLGLPSAGVSHIKTAGGARDVSNFIIDLRFTNSTLTSFINLPIASTDLGFNIAGDLDDPQNFGILIGRDVMAFWNILWNGPTSTVIIND